MRYLCYLLLGMMLLGCVERQLYIVSDPPQANVWIDGQPSGVTPVTIPFSFYGTREITLAYPGYEVYTVLEPIETPIYQYFPLDFIYEFMVPTTIQDEHHLTYTLKPYLPLTPAQKEQLQKNGRLLQETVSSQK